MELSLCAKDYDHLVKFRNSINSNVPIKEKNIRLDGKTYKAYRLYVCSAKMCDDLIKLGCVPKKTFKITFPTYDIVPKEFMRDFLRGFFDGDGCISTTIKNDKPHIQLVIAGIPDMLRSISDFFLDEGVIRVYPKIYKDKRSRISEIFFYGTDSNKEILDYLYKDSHMFLDRKYYKYVDFYKDYKSIDKRGVCWSERNKAYVVSIYENGKSIRIGQSKDIDEAIKMRKEAETRKMKNAHLTSNGYE